MKTLADFNIKMSKEPHHSYVNEALRILEDLSQNHFDGNLYFKNTLNIQFVPLSIDIEARYNHKNFTIEFNDKLSLDKMEYVLYHEMGHYFDQKLNDLIFKGKSLYFRGCFASDKIENIIDYQSPNQNWTPWQHLYFEREQVEFSSDAKLDRIYDLLAILEERSELFLNRVNFKAWQEKGQNNLIFLSKWVRGVKKFNVDILTAREGWDKWKMSCLSSFSFIPATESKRKQELEFWRYSWEQWIQSVEDLLFPSVLDKDYLEWNSTWRSLVKALQNNGLTYETKESELWANGFANYLMDNDSYALKSDYFGLLPIGKDKAKHDKFWKEMLIFIKDSV